MRVPAASRRNGQRGGKGTITNFRNVGKTCTLKHFDTTENTEATEGKHWGFLGDLGGSRETDGLFDEIYFGRTDCIR